MVKDEDIRKMAYSIWEKEGRPAGKDAEHYYGAKKILEGQEAASATANQSVLPESTFQSPSAPKPFEPHATKRRSKKA
jgi:Protein of unknown function (DUF2934)